LVVPEINGDLVDAFTPGEGGIIANPNCSTIIMLMAVDPIHRAAGVRRMVVSTYQSASGAGAQAMAELEEQSRAVLDKQPAEPKVLPHPCAFNVFSHNSDIGANGYNTEEMKMVHETRKIWNAPDVQVTATCVRVPVLRAHAESINLTLENPLSEDEARERIAAAPGVRIIDDREANLFPMPVDVSGRDEVAVGRIRRDISQPNGLDLFVCGDQIRKGAALNAVQIAERLIG
ncbi:MAG: aspartate-semialdehyde dehydrogenase, partial [Phycisphaeraceae bacterium]|nr:aspartate-semialdehyde dehydrogenase [Phycisphaeraceae bacterium]